MGSGRGGAYVNVGIRKIARSPEEVRCRREKGPKSRLRPIPPRLPLPKLDVLNRDAEDAILLDGPKLRVLHTGEPLALRGEGESEGAEMPGGRPRCTRDMRAARVRACGGVMRRFRAFEHEERVCSEMEVSTR